MRKSLFRPQAIEHMQHRLHGEVLIIPKRFNVVICLFLCAWVIALCSWLILGQYARQETVNGWLEPPTGVVRVYAQQHQGVVSSILVADGQQVNRGDPLLTITGEQRLRSGLSVQQSLLDEYYLQRQHTQSQLREQRHIFGLKQQVLEQHIDTAETAVTNILAQQKTLQQRLSIISARLTRLRGIQSSGHIAQNDIELLREQQLSIVNQGQRLKRDLNQQQSRVSQLLADKQILPSEFRHQVTLLQQTLSEIKQKITQVEGQQEYTLAASRDGIVTNLHIDVGQSIEPNQVLLSIVPGGQALQAKLIVPIRAAGFLVVGQSVDIRYDAFPYQKFGLYQAQLNKVSDTVLLPKDFADPPINITEPVYLVTASLHSSQIKAFGKPVNLKTGMTFSADITLSQRSLLEWMLEPILSLRGTM